nr:hypothetical protein [Serratia liquefaciens]
MEPAPKATLLAKDTVVLSPSARALFTVIAALAPNATELTPLIFDELPIAIDLLPVALLDSPMARAACPVAFEETPNAIAEKSPPETPVAEDPPPMAIDPLPAVVAFPLVPDLSSMTTFVPSRSCASARATFIPIIEQATTPATLNPTCFPLDFANSDTTRKPDKTGSQTKRYILFMTDTLINSDISPHAAQYNLRAKPPEIGRQIHIAPASVIQLV